MQRHLPEPKRILLAVADGKRRLKQKKLNIFNSAFCCSSPDWERKTPEVCKFSDCVSVSVAFFLAKWTPGFSAEDDR